MKALVVEVQEKNTQVGILMNVSDEAVKDCFRADLQKRYGHVVPSKDAVRMFGASHGLPVIDGKISVDAVSRKLMELRALALISAM
ncbi:hypothetical protein [Methylovorus glucosotrophus]|uniref:hypothetical protein n=1 Tax=Methylovorus glucosotrophus TaxID=266009 RepID=UPI00059E8592|nr:hypothetical protein [Methylovorus glucosotrophus]